LLLSLLKGPNEDATRGLPQLYLHKHHTNVDRNASIPDATDTLPSKICKMYC
jgi:hypothetical protein